MEPVAPVEPVGPVVPGLARSPDGSFPAAPTRSTSYVAGVALVSRTSVASRFSSPFDDGAKRTHSVQVSPPGRRPRHVEAEIRKSSAFVPVKLSPVTWSARAPSFRTLTSWGALTVVRGWDANSRSPGDTVAIGCVRMSGIGLTWPLLLAPQQATPPSVATAQPWKLPRLNAV